MAKKAKKQSDAGLVSPATEAKIEEFAEDLGRLLGTAKIKAQSWLDQRKAITEHLTGLRDTANQLLAQLGVGGGAGRRRPGRRPKDHHFTAPVDTVAPSPKKRTMSAEARAKIAAAQRARWAKQKKVAARG
jgi:hypothetical protein